MMEENHNHFDEGKLFSKMVDKEIGLLPNYWPPEVWIDVLIKTLLHLEENVEYDINDLRFMKDGTQDWDEVLYYLEKIELIKDTNERFSIDDGDQENDYRLYKFVCDKAPDIEIIDEHKFIVTDSPFYRALNDGQKALFYILNNPDIKYPYYNINIPDKYKTREFYEYMNIYYGNSTGPSFFYISEKGSDMILKINTIISNFCNELKNISLDDAIEEIQDKTSTYLNGIQTKAIAFTKKDK